MSDGKAFARNSVSPEVTAEFVAARCRSGATIALRPYAGASHATIARESAGEVANWIGDRFAGKSAPSTCDTRDTW